LSTIGFGLDVIHRELLYLIRAGLVEAEHFQTDAIDDEDLVKLRSPGFVHLELLENFDYLAAVSEDTWYADKHCAEVVAQRLGDRENHYSKTTALKNADVLVGYLETELKSAPASTVQWLTPSLGDELLNLELARRSIQDAVDAERRKNPWYGADERFKSGVEVVGQVVSVSRHGVFVDVASGVRGIIPASFIKAGSGRAPVRGDRIVVRVDQVREMARRLSLRFVSFVT
jgi:hypothetical protein